MPTADEYRRLTAECLELAPKISADLRDIFISLAQGWAQLADFLDEDPSILPDAPATAEGDIAENSSCDADARGKDWVK